MRRRHSAFVHKKKKIAPGKGIRVGVANKQTMEQHAEGDLPFARIPSPARNVQLFPTMQSPLLSGGILATNNTTVVLGSINAAIVTGDAQRSLQQIIDQAPAGDIIVTVPFDPLTSTCGMGVETSICQQQKLHDHHFARCYSAHGVFHSKSSKRGVG